MKKHLLPKILVFIKEAFTKNISLKFISMFITLTIFILVAGESIQISKKVKIEYVTPPQMMIVNEVPFEFDVILSGPKSLVSSIREQNLYYKVDLTGAEPGPVQARLTADKLNLSRRILVSSMVPSSVYPRLERIITKKVLIKLRAINRGGRIKSYFIEPSEIEISGPQSKLEKINFLYTEILDIGQLTQGGSHNLFLTPLPPQISLINFKSDKIKVHIELISQ